METEKLNYSNQEVEKRVSLDDSVNDFTTIIGRGTFFEGNLTFEGTAAIAGRFRGEIFTRDKLVISDGADVEGQIEADEVKIYGTVKGNVFARRRIDMYPPAVFKGTVSSPCIEIKQGVVFEGASHMSKT